MSPGTRDAATICVPSDDPVIIAPVWLKRLLFSERVETRRIDGWSARRSDAMKRLMAMTALALSVSWLAGCDKTESTTSQAATFTVVPATATAVEATEGLTYTILGDSTHPDKIVKYPWKTSFTVTITETAGVGRDITAASVKVQQASGGIVIMPTGSDIEHYTYTFHASNNRIDAKGSASVGFDVWYDLPNQGREALVTVTFSFTDDNSSSFSESTSVKVM
jgi:predicted small secreted protein